VAGSLYGCELFQQRLSVDFGFHALQMAHETAGCQNAFVAGASSDLTQQALLVVPGMSAPRAQLAMSLASEPETKVL